MAYNFIKLVKRKVIVKEILIAYSVFFMGYSTSSTCQGIRASHISCNGTVTPVFLHKLSRFLATLGSTAGKGLKMCFLGMYLLTLKRRDSDEILGRSSLLGGW